MGSQSRTQPLQTTTIQGGTKTMRYPRNTQAEPAAFRRDISLKGKLLASILFTWEVEASGLTRFNTDFSPGMLRVQAVPPTLT
jgi:hypothetical protein